MKKIFVTLLALAVTACSSPNPNFYQPVAMQTPANTYPNVKSTILIAPVLLPAEQSRPQITTLGKENYEVKIDEFNRWGAAPEKLVQQVLNQNLSLLLPNAMVENQTTLRKNYKYAVFAEIREMNGRLDETALLKASYFIRNAQGKILKQGRFDQALKIEDGYDAYIPAQSRLLGGLSQAIAADLAKLK